MTGVGSLNFVVRKGAAVMAAPFFGWTLLLFENHEGWAPGSHPGVSSGVNPTIEELSHAAAKLPPLEPKARLGGPPVEFLPG